MLISLLGQRKHWSFWCIFQHYEITLSAEYIHIRQAEEEKAKKKNTKKQEQSKLKQNETVYYLVLLSIRNLSKLCLVHWYGPFWKPFPMWAKLSFRVRVIRKWMVLLPKSIFLLLLGTLIDTANSGLTTNLSFSKCLSQSCVYWLGWNSSDFKRTVHIFF